MQHVAVITCAVLKCNMLSGHNMWAEHDSSTMVHCIVVECVWPRSMHVGVVAYTIILC